MNDYLLRYAIDNVWCNLGQDKQFQYELKKLSPRFGVRSHFTVETERYQLPYESDREWFHVYQIGQIVPQNLALPKTYRTWMSMEYLAKEHKMLGEVYVDNGIQFSRANTWVLITPNQNLLVAVKVLPKFPDIEEHQPYIHFYNNAYYKSKRSIGGTRHEIEPYSILPKTNDELRRFQIMIMDRIAATGFIPMCWVNGRAVHEISLVTAGVGDFCEVVLDSSIYKVKEFVLKDTPTFTSTLDSLSKWLFHLPKAEGVDNITFYDDISAFLCKKGAAPNQDRFSGVHYHHNDGKWLRMITHQDWAAPVKRTQAMITQHPEDPRVGTDSRWQSDLWKTSDPMVMRMYFRHYGYERPLVAEVSRINQLYRLRDEDIIRAMTGTDSMPLWHAANLEKSAYAEFMSADPNKIFPVGFQIPEKTTPGKVFAQNWAGDVFGYHEAAHIMADNPSKVYESNGVKVADLRYAYWYDATIFEYTDKGVLLGWHYHSNGSQWSVRDQDCGYVEAVCGRGSNNLESDYGTAPVTIRNNSPFKIYVSKMWGGAPTEWQDVTDLPNRSDWGFLDETVTPNVWRWTVQAKDWLCMIRQGDRFFLEQYRFNKSRGVISITLQHESRSSGTDQLEPIDIPFGQLDVWLADGDGKHGRGLVQGIDYFLIQKKPFKGTMLVLNNLEYLWDISTVIIRGTGFCSKEFKIYEPEEVGFVEYGVLSKDGRHQVHPHKVQGILVDGHYRAASEVKFDEETGQNTITDERNGAPFSIQTPQVMFRDVYDSDTKAREEDDARDKQVSDYLTEYFRKPPPDNPSMSTDPYHVYSAYANMILNEIKTGRLKPPMVNGRMSDMDIVKVVQPYEWLKPYDILNNDYNKNHIRVYPHWHPTPQSLTIVEYDFYRRVLQLGLREIPELSPFIVITRT